MGKLPTNARAYVEYLSRAINVEIGLVSTGPERDQTILCPGSTLDAWLTDE